MTAFTVIGLVIATLFFCWIAALGLFCALFNDIGGNGSRASVLGCLLVFAIGVYGIYWIWSNFSPFTVVVAS